jgi:hypothetical protein
LHAPCRCDADDVRYLIHGRPACSARGDICIRIHAAKAQFFMLRRKAISTPAPAHPLG